MARPDAPHDTERTTRATDEVQRDGTPKQGDRYRCDSCGMEIECMVDCKCTDPDAVHFECCNEEMTRV